MLIVLVFSCSAFKSRSKSRPSELAASRFKSNPPDCDSFESKLKSALPEFKSKLRPLSASEFALKSKLKSLELSVGAAVSVERSKSMLLEPEEVSRLKSSKDRLSKLTCSRSAGGISCFSSLGKAIPHILQNLLSFSFSKPQPGQSIMTSDEIPTSN